MKKKQFDPSSVPARNRILVDRDKYIICSDFLLKNVSSDDEEQKILDCVAAGWHQKRKGYRNGVWMVPLSVQTFKGNIVQLQDGDYLLGRMERRIDKEQPRKKISALVNNDKLLPLKSVDAVIYSNATLREGNENSDLRAHFEIIAVLKKVVEDDQPMPVDTLLYNYFVADGGTDMKCSQAQFIKQLKQSFEFWKDKAIIH